MKGNKLKFEFVKEKPRETEGIEGQINRPIEVTGRMTYGLYGHNPPPIYHNQIQEYRKSVVIEPHMLHTYPIDEVKEHHKRSMFRELYEQMVRDDMVEVWEQMDPSTFGPRLSLRLRVVKPDTG